MAATDAVALARTAYQDRDWGGACEAYAAAHSRNGGLGGSDLGQWAYAALWAGEGTTALGLFERAEDAYRREGDLARAALMALTVAQVGLGTGRLVAAGAAMRRIPALLDGLPESEAHALLAWATAFQVSTSDAEASRPLWEQALECARRVGSATAEAAALCDLGGNLLRAGDRERGQELLEQAAGLALTDQVAPLAAGHVLCQTIWAFRDLGDWRAAAEWADVTWRWLERTKVALYPGVCRLHHCEVIRVRGDLHTAEDEALAGCKELERLMRPAAGYAYRELGEIRLRRGDLEGAQEAFETALGFGVDPQPGLARLRLARGEVSGTVQGLEDALAAKGDRPVADRPFILPVLVTAAIAAGEVERARRAARELHDLATYFDTDAHRAAAAQAAGEIALADGDLDAAHRFLRAAWELWSDVDAPFEAATTQVLLARVAEQRGDLETARVDLAAARGTFERIGARFEAARVGRFLADRAGPGQPEQRAFMFTDIEDSTRLQIAMGDERWLSLLAWHDRTLRAVIEDHAGVEVKHRGDGFFAVFDAPGRALDCAAEIQRRLARHRRDHGFAPDVRIGLHAGEATVHDGDYIGEAVTVAARIAAAAQAGQVWCSEAALPQGATPEDFFDLQLKGLPDPVRVAAIVPA